MGEDLAVGIEGLAKEYGVRHFVFGGGLMDNHLIFRELTSVLKNLTDPRFTYARGVFGNDAGMIGAAAEVFNSLGDINPSAVTIGVDIGGTKIALGLIDTRGRITNKPLILDTEKNADSVIATVKLGVQHMLVEDASLCSRLLGVGACSPGIIDNGVIEAVSFLLEGKQYPLLAELAKAVSGIPEIPSGLSFSLINDAEAATLGEQTYGAGKGKAPFIMLTFGTGLGGGFVSPVGRVRNIEPGERTFIGRVYGDEATVTQSFPGKIPFEKLVSGTALARRVREALFWEIT
jgi:glucokinase